MSKNYKCIVCDTKFKLAHRNASKYLCSKKHYFKCPDCGNIVLIDNSGFFYFHGTKRQNVDIKIIKETKSEIIFTIERPDLLVHICDKCYYDKNITKQRRKRRTDKAKKTCQRKYNCDNPAQAEPVKQKIRETNLKNTGYTCALADPAKRAKGCETKELKYGDPNFNNPKKARRTYRKRTGFDNPSQNPEVKKKKEETCLTNHGVRFYMQSASGKANFKRTCLFNYGVEHPMQVRDIWLRAQHTMHKNASNSSWENLFYEWLINLGLKENIDFEREYKCERYPFNCDFYIYKYDLFIEINGYATHGRHFFDKNNKDDLKRLKELKKKAKLSKKKKTRNFYNTMINVWTKQDLKKKFVAENNNLNYIVLWDLSDIELFFQVFNLFL